LIEFYSHWHHTERYYQWKEEAAKPMNTSNGREERARKREREKQKRIASKEPCSEAGIK
jgi:hypothetical protein